MLSENSATRAVMVSPSSGRRALMMRMEKSAMYPTPIILPMVPIPMRERS